MLKGIITCSLIPDLFGQEKGLFGNMITTEYVLVAMVKFKSRMFVYIALFI